MTYKILFIGPQGSGKGTQAQILAQKFNVPIFSTGNILRQRIKQGDELGKEIENIINAGHLAPDDLVNRIVAEKIKMDGQNGYILDGYPRNLAQAEFLDGVDELTHVLEIDLPEGEAIRRISGRRTCPKCQAVYHLKYNPPKNKGVCNKDGEALIIRADEREAAVKTRLKNYHKLTEPILEFYQQKGIYHKIDGMPPIAEVNKEILEIL